VLVPFRDAPAIAREVIGLLRDDTRRHAIRKNAYKLGREMVWNNVARLYMRSFELSQIEGRRDLENLSHEDARPKAAGTAGVEVESSLADDRFDRNLPACHFYRPEFFGRLLYG